MRRVLAMGWLCFIGGIAWAPFAMQHRHPGDLLAYHAAGRAMLEGHDPYVLENLHGASTPFVYSPLAWPWARALALLDWETLQKAYFALKVAALLALAFTWRAWFRGQPLAFAVTLMLGLVGFRLAVRIDLFTGNVAIFEALLVWSALLQLRAGRAGWFSVLLSLGSLLKLAPLGLFVLLRSKRAWALSVLAWACAVGASVAVMPEAWREFVQAVAMLDERGPQNPTMLSLLRDLGLPWPWLGWALWSAGVIALTTWALRRRPSFELASMLVMLAWALVLPRFKDYSYVMLLPAAAQALVWAGLRRWPLTVVLAVMLVVPLHPYQRLVAATLTWAMLMAERPPTLTYMRELRDLTASAGRMATRE
jgi:hypothetical protein